MAAWSVVVLAASAGALVRAPTARALPAVGTSSLTVVLSNDGTLAGSLVAWDTNGSALRYAIDGDFRPLLDLLPINASTRSALLANLNASESNPLVAGLFGNHDGSVEPGEVSQFADLVTTEAQYFPASFLNPSFVHLTVDGGGATAYTFTGLGLPGAVGPDRSTTPIAIEANVSYHFPITGASHTVRLQWVVPVGFSLVAPGPIDFAVSGPAGTSVTSTSGLGSAAVRNDPLGWGTSAASGTVDPTTDGNATVAFGPAFPIGDILVVLAVAGPAGVVGAVLLRRRRRHRPPPADAPAG
ncbi:MAG TPA: hypothetical protein VFF67_06990 [Thermoplasmata archaeon]|nr:hypothetical protein [Thermoplasmata archaeon]